MSITYDEHNDRVRNHELRIKPSTVTMLPDPPRARRKYTLVSVDDHLCEPPDVFHGRLARQYVDRAPVVLTDDNGHDWWHFEGKRIAYVGLDAVVGRPRVEALYPKSFDEMRKGVWNVHERIRDMDLDGVYASLTFPSMLTGFAGGRLQTATEDHDLALALVRAWNDWNLEDWAGAYPDRIIPCQLPWLHDPMVGAEEIRKNADRGFHAVTFPEAPEKLGLPSVHSPIWDPFMAACAETGTVVCLHIGSGGSFPVTTPDAPPEVSTLLFGLYALNTAVDWVYSRIPARIPDLKICLSEGGIGWVVGLLDRLEHSFIRSRQMYRTWEGFDVTPAEVFRRNFWLCSVDDPSSFVQIDRIGVDRVMIESDYPHSDSSWPDTQAHVEKQLHGVTPDIVRRITWGNASELFRHPVPANIQSDPDAF